MRILTPAARTMLTLPSPEGRGFSVQRSLPPFEGLT
jgi:hypothetical protein